MYIVSGYLDFLCCTRGSSFSTGIGTRDFSSFSRFWRSTSFESAIPPRSAPTANPSGAKIPGSMVIPSQARSGFAPHYALLCSKTVHEIKLVSKPPPYQFRDYSERMVLGTAKTGDRQLWCCFFLFDIYGAKQDCIARCFYFCWPVVSYRQP